MQSHRRPSSPSIRALATSAIALIVAVGGGDRVATHQPGATVSTAVIEKAQADGRVRVIVRVDVPARPEGELDGPAAVEQRQVITDTQNTILDGLAATDFRVARQFDIIPYMALEVTPEALARLAQQPGVLSVVEDELSAPSLADSTTLVKATNAWTAGYDGTGWTVAVLDTGVDKTHSFLTGKVVSEACYSGNSNCPNGGTTDTAAGAGVNCAYAPTGCRHGTHVAGIAAGTSGSFSGVAKGASVIAIQVFSRFTSGCGSETPCALSFSSDQVAGLLRVYDLRSTYQIAAANMSLGGSTKYISQAACDSDNTLNGRKAAIDTLRSVGIAMVIASGNSGYVDGMGAPGCISTAVSVGSTSKADAVSSFSNSASFLSLLAPGQSINSSIPGGAFDFFNGTSMATPHVAGAWAILKQYSPAASVTTILDALRTSATVTDSRNGIATPRIDLLTGLDALGGTRTLAINDVSLVEGNAGTSTATFTVSLSAAAFSTVTVNYQTADGTAASSSDFVATSGTLTFTAGQTSQTFGVVVNGDTTVESNESFAVNLSAATGASISDSQGFGTIVDDDTGAFTDPTVTAGETTIRAVHITELRTRIDNIRIARGLSAFAYTDPTLTVGSTAIKAVHILELRTALADAYVAAGRAVPTYTGATPGAGTAVLAASITELRAAVFAIE